MSYGNHMLGHLDTFFFKELWFKIESPMVDCCFYCVSSFVLVPLLVFVAVSPSNQETSIFNYPLLFSRVWKRGDLRPSLSRTSVHPTHPIIEACGVISFVSRVERPHPAPRRTRTNNPSHTVWQKAVGQPNRPWDLVQVHLGIAFPKNRSGRWLICWCYRLDFQAGRPCIRTPAGSPPYQFRPTSPTCRSVTEQVAA